MATSLKSIKNRFLLRVSTADGAFHRHLVEPSTKFRTHRFALQEGLVSLLWQTWCTFCRDVVIASARSALTDSGAITSSPYSGNNEKEVAYVARKVARGERVTSIREISGSYLEPTWGDPAKLNSIITGLGSSNSPALLSAFGVSTRIQDLQMCRNTCAHLNGENITIMQRAKVRYNSTRMQHPSDFIFWEDPLTQDFVWRSWIDEMEIIAAFATQ
ncbi:hypothetical protein MAA8898_01216 [Maliponia aquimaris]|uniref:Uncharacterized protein n=1 Tax=Maliponia aquimaris TaxID=1673631 RepID=A0A238K6C5_9RHOB|nr:hypothetical protein MAA8898_01216 [Maliponia aquimaris]